MVWGIQVGLFTAEEARILFPVLETAIFVSSNSAIHDSCRRHNRQHKSNLIQDLDELACPASTDATEHLVNRSEE